MKIQNDTAQILIKDRIKTPKFNHFQPVFKITKLSYKENVCVLIISENNVSRTEQLRDGDKTYLFISHRKPYQVVSSRTLSRWIKDIFIFFVLLFCWDIVL